MKMTTYLKVRIDVDDAEDFIASKLESETGAKAIVTIEPKLRQFELFPCLLAAQNAYNNCGKETSPTVAAIKALREYGKERCFEFSLTDCKAVVDTFIAI